MSQRNNDNFLVATILGAIVGAVCAIFLTPKTGPQMRQEVKDKIEKLPDECRDIISEAKSLYSRVSDTLLEMADDTNATTAEWKHKVNHAKDIITEQKSKIERAINEAKKALDDEKTPLA